MDIYDELKLLREHMPRWLASFDDQTRFDRAAFFSGRVVFYPGSGTDGQPVKLFASTHAAHCFVYADYLLEQALIERELDHPTRGFRGYLSAMRVQLTQLDLLSVWTPHVLPDEVRTAARFSDGSSAYAFLEVMEREPELGDEHGPERIAVLFLGADGIATYDALFCQEASTARPFALVLQDHGFGANYESFGAGGLLERIARRMGVLPDYLLVGGVTRPWAGFKRCNGSGDIGGMHREPRSLWLKLPHD